MSHRTQITLTDHQYELLRGDAAEKGLSIAELVRRALDDAYSRQRDLEDKLQVVKETAGIWADRPRIGAELAALRKPMGPTPG